MSRFNVKSSKLTEKSLSSDQVEILFAELTKKISCFAKAVRTEIVSMQVDGTLYRVLTPDSEFVVVIRRASRVKSRLCIGYPFPVISKTVSEYCYGGFEISYFIRGKSVRSAQRERFLQRLAQRYICSQNGFYTISSLQQVLKKHIKTLTPEILCYIDLYHFIGDSFLSLYMLDAFVEMFKTPKSVILSSQHKHLAGFYNAMDLSQWNTVQSNGIYVFSDLLDIDDAWVQNAIINTNKDGIFIINSRNCFIIKKKNHIDLYYLKYRDDVILRQGNIFPYMQRCIEPFVQTNINNKRKMLYRNDIKRIYINPFASIAEKCLNENEISALVTRLYYEFPQVQLIIPYGHNDETQGYSKDIARKLKLSRIKDRGFYDLITQFQSTDLILTMDTALTHISTKCGIRNIVMFKDGFWDPLSLQSMSAESPLSFCSKSCNQLPVVLKQTCNFDEVIYVIKTLKGIPTSKCNIDFSFKSKRFNIIENLQIIKTQGALSAKNKLKHYIKGL